MTKINKFLHLWLGLISGLIVFVVCIMACLWVFQEEITDLIYPPVKIRAQEGIVLQPSAVLAVTDSLYPGESVRFINYQADRPLSVGLGKWDNKPFDLLIHPYTGKVLGKVADKKRLNNFFNWVLDGHRFLWLPWKVGRPIVNYAILIFVITLVTGLIWWYPKKWNKSTRNKSFKIKWNANWKRVNIDLHNVLGFYAFIILFILACTGMVYGISWFSKGLYWSTNWGDPEPEWPRQVSDTTLVSEQSGLPKSLDIAFHEVVRQQPQVSEYNISIPDTTDVGSVISINTTHIKGKYYTSSYFSFDRYTLQELPHNELYGRDFSQNTFGQKLRRMNYDIHIGSVLGLPGKILAFFASLTGASLPVTGFIIWYNRKWGKKKKKAIRRIQISV